MKKIALSEDINLNVKNNYAEITPRGKSKMTTKSEVIEVPSKNLFNESYYSDTKLYNANKYFAYVRLPDSFRTKFYGNMFLKGKEDTRLAIGFSDNINGVTKRIYDKGKFNTNVEYDFTNSEKVYFLVGNTKGVSIAKDVVYAFANYNIMVTKSPDTVYEPFGTTTTTTEGDVGAIENIESDIEIKITNGLEAENESYKEQSIIFPLVENQKLYEGSYLSNDGIHHKRNHYTLPEVTNLTTTTVFGSEVQIAAYTLPNVKQTGKKYNFLSDKIGPANESFGKYKGYINLGQFIVMTTSDDTLENFNSNVSGAIIEYEVAEEEIIDYTEEQKEVFEQLNSVELFNGTNNITAMSNISVPLKVEYESKTEEDKQIYVLDKNEVLIAVFNKDDEYPIYNPRITDTQNSESVFTFNIDEKNPKWKEINNPENLYYADGKVYSTNFEGCFTETITETDEDYVTVTAYERQKLLTRRYVRAWNSETGFEKIDTFMVVVLSNGNLALKNNDELVKSSHLPGTSGYALDALLYGTGWTTGTCDVEGTFDLETDQVDIWENVLKVQQIWGGILVVDSVNKIIHHRDETKWLPYDGYEVRYKKNMQSLEKTFNNKIITKLCPLGESGLNIKSVNNGSEWITNFSYTSSILEGIENNPDIVDSEQLKKWGERKLKDLCKPRKELQVSTFLLYQVEGYELERIGLNDIVDVINFAGVEGDIEQLRVVKFDYGIWDYSDATVDLSDITLDSTDIFKKTVSATNSINNGTLNAKNIVDFFKNGQSVSSLFKIIDREIIDTKTDVIKTDERLEATITKYNAKINELNNEIIESKKTIENLLVTIDGLKNTIGVQGGSNLIRNSVGVFGTEYWEGNVSQYTDTDVFQNNESKSSIILPNGDILQKVGPIKNGMYNISFNYKKKIAASNVKVSINDSEYVLDSEEWQLFEKAIKISNNQFIIKFSSDTVNSCLISDLILIFGENRNTWSQNSNETTTDTVQIGKGIRVDSTITNTYTRLDSDGNRTFNKSTDEVVTEQTDQGTNTNNLKVRTQAEVTGLLQQKHGDQVWVNVL